MDDSQNNALSDLIYLYLDGEAGSLEHSMLFGALARNSDLQAEFTEALRIRSAVEQERALALPPAHLTDALFRKAGFATAAAETAAAAGPGAFGRFLARFGAPMLSAAASALLTALLLTGIYQSRLERVAGEMRQIRTVQRAPLAENPGRSSALPHSPRTGAGSGEAERAIPERLHDGTPHAVRGAGSGSTAASPAFAAGRDQFPRQAPPQASGRTEAPEGTLPAATPSLMKTLPAAGTAIPTESIAAAAGPLGEATPFPPADRDEPDYRFAFQIRGITGLGLYPERPPVQGTQPWFNNMSVGALYRISRHHAIGVEAGQEIFPLYRSNGASSWLEPRLAWAGGVYRFEPEGMESLGDLRPFLQTTLGGTPSGPIAKGIAGIAYTPGSRVDLSIGFEGTALLYQLQGSWYSTRKSGITYLMNVHF